MLFVIFLSLTSCTFFSFSDQLNNNVINKCIWFSFLKFIIHIIFNTHYFISWKYFTLFDLIIVFTCKHYNRINTRSGTEGVNLTIVLLRYFFVFRINHFNYVLSCKLVLIIELFIFLIWLLNIINVLFSDFNIINLFIFLKIRQNSEVKQISFPLILNLTYI